MSFITHHSSLHLGVVILGAGASSRMGKPKLLLPWEETTIIGHLISQWQELNASQIAIVVRPNDDLLFAELKRLNFPMQNCIENSQPEHGMFSSILCAANWNGWNKEISHFAIALGDQPHLEMKTLQTLLKFVTQNPQSICQPMCGNRIGHPAILPREIFGELQHSRAGTLKDFLKHFSGQSVQCVINDSGVTLDLDTPEDYNRVRAT
ncbi:MAG TPA: nucleotidyltransferase family protein [Candidatus Baltobacteraceae bacterium]|nr:nucleotidyltransferase family protein [Candidatus Baltobacteraceae bacterium]